MLVGLALLCAAQVPSFVSGEHIVFFDPHAESLPGATPSNPGLKIRFAVRCLRSSSGS